MTWNAIKKSAEWQNFTTPFVDRFFTNMDSDAKREKTWNIICLLKQNYPYLDIYTHGKVTGNIVFGRNVPNQGRGSVCLLLVNRGANLPTLSVNNIIDPKRPELQFDQLNVDKDIAGAINDFLKPHNKEIKKFESPTRNRYLPHDFVKNNAAAPKTNELIQQPNTSGTKTMNHPLNMIFFGPPGTGKTYTTIERAVEVCDPTFEEAKTRADFKKRYQELVKEGQIVFTTFHQSYSYEDFIEGIRAETTEEGGISYAVKSGIFKELCEEANKHLINPSQLTLLEELKLEAENKDVRLQTLARQADFMIRYDKKNDRFDCSPLSSQNTYGATVGNIERYLVDPSTPMTNKSYVSSIAKYIIEKAGSTNLSTFSPKNFVIIIDEINRGNISRIFGELITLIEESKRLGHKDKEDLSVKLPYSQDPFSVPNNVYIIGTMNTADRSLAGLDLALRRRFDFKEMMPDVATLKGIKVGNIEIDKLLTVINQRIEVLLDREHTIGHAYFIGLNNTSTITDLASIFKNKVIPLLQEYFYEDWEKINMVLGGNQFITEKPINNNLFKKPQNDAMQLNNKTIWSISGDDVFENEAQYTAIYASINNGA